MTLEELIEKLREISNSDEGPEYCHEEADRLLLEYINSPEVTKAFQAIEKWYV